MRYDQGSLEASPAVRFPRFPARTRVVFGADSLARLGDLARELGFTRTLLVADPGLVSAGHVDRAAGVLANAGIEVAVLSRLRRQPRQPHGRGRARRRGLACDRFARGARGRQLARLRQGHQLRADQRRRRCATIGDSARRRGRCCRPIGVPTTAGTGSEAQSYAIISDAETHQKMACGDPKAAFRIAVLDPALTVTSRGRSPRLPGTTRCPTRWNRS